MLRIIDLPVSFSAVVGKTTANDTHIFTPSSKRFHAHSWYLVFQVPRQGLLKHRGSQWITSLIGPRMWGRLCLGLQKSLSLAVEKTEK